ATVGKYVRVRVDPDEAQRGAVWEHHGPVDDWHAREKHSEPGGRRTNNPAVAWPIVVVTGNGVIEPVGGPEADKVALRRNEFIGEEAVSNHPLGAMPDTSEITCN